MEFKINETRWTIEETDEANINYVLDTKYASGATVYKDQKVLLLKDQANIIKTLKHELTHVWLYEYGHNQHDKEYNCEDVCEIVSSINDFINDIVEDYMNKSVEDAVTTINKEEAVEDE